MPAGTPTAPKTSSGVDFGAANGVGGLGGLKNPAAIAPGLGMVNSNNNGGKSAWETGKDKTSQGVAGAAKQEYISYLDQQSQKPAGEVSGGGLRAPGLSMTSPTDKSVWEQGKDQASQIAADAAGKDYVPYVEQQYQQAQKEASTPGIDSAPTIDTPVINPGLSPTPDTGIPGTNSPLADTPAISTGTGGSAGSGNAPSVGSAPLPTATDMSDYIREYYAVAEERAKNAAEEAYLSSLEAIDAEAAKLPAYYDEARRQQTGQNALERKAMNERFAASGLNTGTAGQAALAQSAVNQNAMAQIRRAEADAMAAVESRRREVAIEYEAKVRDAVLSGDMAKAQALFAEAQRVDESIVNVAMQQAQLDIQQQQLDMQAQNNAYRRAQDAEARAEAKAKMLASVGDFSGYKALGWTDDEIAVLKGYWDAENAKPTYGYSGGVSPTVNVISTPNNIGANVTQLQASGENKETIGAYIAAAVEQGLISPQDAIWLRNG